VCACTPFGADGGGDGGVSVNDGAVADGGGGVDGGDGGEGPPVDAGSCGLAGADFCDDFESDDWRSRWNATGSVSATPGDAVSGTRSIEIERLVGSTPKLIAHELDATKKVFKLTVRMRVLKAGDGEMDLIAITETNAVVAPFGKGLFIARPQGRTTYVLEGPGITRVDLAGSFSTWTKLTLVLDLGNHRYSLDDGDGHFEGPFDATWNPSTLFVQLGAFWEPVVKLKDWQVRFDDVAVTSRP